MNRSSASAMFWPAENVARVAEMQLAIIGEESPKRFPAVGRVGEPTRTHSSFIHGYETMPVVIPARA